MKKLLKPILFAASLVFAHAALAEETALPATLPATTPAAIAEHPEYHFTLTYADAEEAIGNALAEKGAGKKVAATITAQKDSPLFSYDKPIIAEIRGLNFDAANGHWSASIMAVADGQVVTAAPVAGRYEEVLETPVLKRQVRGGEIISEDDIQLLNFPVSRTRAGTVTNKADLVGKSPARTISALRPIREQELDNPSLIKKNAIVQMRYTMPGMEISTTGQAISDGAKGSMIAVRNLSSKKIVRAIVENENTVNVPSNAVTTAVEARATTEETHVSN